MKLKVLLILVTLLFSTSFKIPILKKHTDFDIIDKELKKLRLDIEQINKNLDYLEAQDSLNVKLK